MLCWRESPHPGRWWSEPLAPWQQTPILMVLLTHGHLSFIGGLTGDGRLIIRDATYLSQRRCGAGCFRYGSSVPNAKGKVSHLPTVRRARAIDRYWPVAGASIGSRPWHRRPHRGSSSHRNTTGVASFSEQRRSAWWYRSSLANTAGPAAVTRHHLL